MTSIQRAIAACVCLAFTAVASALPAKAQSRGGLSLIRDAEIEALLKDYTSPLLQASGSRSGAVDIRIVNDDSFNAFVSGRGLFVHTGLLMQAETPNEVIGVLAHEIGHIVGGHQLRLRERIESAARAAKIATFLGVGLAGAGAATGVSGLGRAGIGLASSAGNFALRDILRYQRDEEQSADRTAVRLLKQSKQSADGMLTTFNRLARQSNIMAGRVDPYLLSHPTPNERLSRLRAVIGESPYAGRKDDAALQRRHDMVRAKIAAYGGSRYGRSLLTGKSLSGDARLYGQAITTYLYGSPRKAIPMIDKLAARLPKDAYVQEMKGEILLRSGKAAEAVGPFRKAVALDTTKSGFMRVELGHALLETGKPDAVREAAEVLQQGLVRDPGVVAGYPMLARAKATLGDEPGAQLASAEYALRTGRKADARSFAARAQQSFKRGSPQWLRAQDIIEYK
ncbi:M48 family metalloprotease [Rhizobiaceae bacterium]|nr:M48 family metalloprotease [Rhizobiaceae bacterium]